MRFLFFIFFLPVFCGVSLSVAFSEETKTENHQKATIPLAADGEDSMTIYLNRVKEYFKSPDGEQAGAAGNVVNWLKESSGAGGMWEYKVVYLENTDAVNLQTNLNELGNNRWDCFFVKEYGTGFYLFFKRPKK